MFKSILGFRRRPSREVPDALYEAIVASARQTFFYSDCEVPDTPLGRYEMLCVHLFLFLHRFKGAGGAEGALAQDVTDAFITDVDDSLRQLGIGDMGIPRRVKKLARMFYGRAASYGEACEAGDAGALAEALRRNIRPETEQWPEAGALAAYMLESVGHLANQPNAAILAGKIEFLAWESIDPGKR